MKRLEQVLLHNVLPAAKRLKRNNIILGEESHPRRIEQHPTGPGAMESYYTHYHNLPEFCWCLSGKCIIQVDMNYYGLEAGDICLISRNTHHFESFFTARQNYEVIWFIFSSVSEILIAHCQYRQRRHKQLQSVHLEIPETIVQELDSLLEQDQASPKLTKAVSGFITGILGLYQLPPGKKEEFIFADRRKSNYQIRRILQAEEFMQEHYAEKLTLERIAKQVDLNPEYFDRLFHQLLKRTPVQYLTIIRLQRAQKFMNETNLSLAEISYRVGFNDPYYFSKVFKKYYGLSPRQFRDKYTKIN
jgi:AraC-like DNA-binding protein